MKDEPFSATRSAGQSESGELAGLRKQMAFFGEGIRESMRPMREALQEATRRISLDVSWQRFTNEVASTVASQLSGVRQAIKRSVENLNPRAKEALLTLGEHGWYLDEEMTFPILWELSDDFMNGRVLEAQQVLVEHFERRESDIEAALIARFPNRRRLISAAFKAHRQGDYELSIPVLLAQADGICKDTVDGYLFVKRCKRPMTAEYATRFAAGGIMEALLSPLANTLPIGASKHERSEEFTGLNRHMVLHGESLDYGTKANSLKAISLVGYIAHVLSIAQQNESGGSTEP